MPSSDVAHLQGQSEVLDPFTGQLVDVSDPLVAAEFVDALRGSKNAIDKVIREVTAIFMPEFERRGTKTVNAGRWVLSKEEQVEYQWDIEELEKLLDAGLPPDRWKELVKETRSVKVSQSVAKQLEAANPDYKVIIEQARTKVDKPARLGIEPAKAAIEE